jgi:glycine dehydrogenase subunit 1
MMEIGEGILLRSRYAMMELDRLPGVRAPHFEGTHFKEFVVSFDGTGKSVAEINEALLARGIFGGKDLTGEFPKLGNSALYCVTEVHTKQDIDTLAGALREVVG